MKAAARTAALRSRRPPHQFFSSDRDRDSVDFVDLDALFGRASEVNSGLLEKIDGTFAEGFGSKARNIPRLVLRALAVCIS